MLFYLRTVKRASIQIVTNKDEVSVISRHFVFVYMPLLQLHMRQPLFLIIVHIFLCVHRLQQAGMRRTGYGACLFDVRPRRRVVVFYRLFRCFPVRHKIPLSEYCGRTRRRAPTFMGSEEPPYAVCPNHPCADGPMRASASAPRSFFGHPPASGGWMRAGGGRVSQCLPCISACRRRADIPLKCLVIPIRVGILPAASYSGYPGFACCPGYPGSFGCSGHSGYSCSYFFDRPGYFDCSCFFGPESDSP